FLRKFLVQAFAAYAVSVSFHGELGGRILVQDLDDVDHYRGRFCFDAGFSSVEQDGPGVVVQLLLNFFGNLWATVVGNSTGNFWTLIVLVKYAVTIGIRPRASVVFRRTGLTWALIVLVGNTVTVSIGTSGQSGSSGFVWT